MVPLPCPFLLTHILDRNGIMRSPDQVCSSNIGASFPGNAETCLWKASSLSEPDCGSAKGDQRTYVHRRYPGPPFRRALIWTSSSSAELFFLYFNVSPWTALVTNVKNLKPAHKESKEAFSMLLKSIWSWHQGLFQKNKSMATNHNKLSCLVSFLYLGCIESYKCFRTLSWIQSIWLILRRNFAASHFFKNLHSPVLNSQKYCFESMAQY